MPGYRRQLYRDDAVVLRVQKLGESDRIITLLTRRHGRVRAVARGRTPHHVAVRRPAGAVRPHRPAARRSTRSEPGSSLHTVSQVEGIDLYGKQFLDDYPRYTAASAIAETAERLTPVEQEPSLRLFQLTLGALRALAAGEHAGTLVLDAYLLRAMALAGWAPALAECAVCGTPGRHRRVLGAGRGLRLPRLPPARRGPPGAGHARPDVRADRRATGGSPTRPSRRRARECSGLVAAHLQWHLERGLRSLPLVDREPDEESP